MEKLSLKKTSSRAKITGAIVSISGAFIVTLYKGPSIPITPRRHLLATRRSNWVSGSLFLTAEYLLIPLWYIIQIMKEYPSELTVVFFYNLCVSIVAAVAGFVDGLEAGVWRLGLDIALASVICSGVFGSFMGNAVHTWALRLKGPVYVAMFKPLSIVIALTMGVTFLADTFHLGSVIGATIISFGFYTVMWGKAKEMCEELENQKTPLLPTQKVEV